MWVVLVTTVTLVGCRSVPGGDYTAGAVVADPHLIAGYGLLHELMSKQGGVDKLLMVKQESEKTRGLVEEIARLCRRTSDALEAFEAETPGLLHGGDALPLIERATRDAIEAETGWSLLTAGDDFEVKLLMSQAEALSYGAHLAAQIAEIEPRRRRAEWLGKLSNKLQALRGRVLAQIVGG